MRREGTQVIIDVTVQTMVWPVHLKTAAPAERAAALSVHGIERSSVDSCMSTNEVAFGRKKV